MTQVGGLQQEDVQQLGALRMPETWRYTAVNTPSGDMVKDDFNRGKKISVTSYCSADIKINLCTLLCTV